MKKFRSIYADWNDSTQPLPPKVNGPTFWATGEDLIRLAENAQTVSCWDFCNALGDTILEKYESLLGKINELTAQLIRKNAAGYFWIVTSPEICSIIETSPRCGFEPILSEKFVPSPVFDNQYPIKNEEILDIGTINKKWRLFRTNVLDPKILLMGVNNYEEEHCCYARLMINNFII